VVAERGPTGVRLVAIDERGDRSFVLVKPAVGMVRDTNPTISPDRWVVFASSRGRPFDETNLWIAPLGVDAVPVQLTHGPAIDSHPTWTRDGKAIVYASAAPSDGFDLWRLPIDRDGHPGAAVQLTRGRGHEVTPSVAPDGTIVFAEVTVLAAGQIESRLEELRPDGTTRPLTDGPADASPAVSPDGTAIAFARPVVRGDNRDGDLWRLDRKTGAITRLLDLPLTDESGPVWSPDGRQVFATSLLHKADGSPLFSSVIVVDLGEPTPRARLLEDRAGAIPRLTPAIPHGRLDRGQLLGDPEYLPALARIIAAALAEEASDARSGHTPAPR